MTKKQQTIYLDPALYASLTTLAKLHRRSLNDMINLTLEAGIEVFRQEYKQHGGKLPVPKKHNGLATEGTPIVRRNSGGKVFHLAA